VPSGVPGRWPRIVADRSAECLAHGIRRSAGSWNKRFQHNGVTRVVPRLCFFAFSRGLSFLTLVTLTACQRPSPPAETSHPAVVVVDSLALRISDTVSIWFTDRREDRDSVGTPCVERVLQVRRGGRSIPVPLLYTGAAPVRVNDSTIEAELWLHCRAVDRYRVDLHSGHPVRVSR
jgi:hypothetical protein